MRKKSPNVWLTNGRVFSLEFLSVARSRTTFLHRSSATAETVCPFIMTEIERKCAFQKLKHGWTLVFHKNSPLDSKVALSTLTQKKVTIQIDALEKTFWIARSISGETRKSHLLSERLGKTSDFEASEQFKNDFSIPQMSSEKNRRMELFFLQRFSFLMSTPDSRKQHGPTFDVLYLWKKISRVNRASVSPS